mgnify:CR=1 FL=1
MAVILSFEEYRRLQDLAKREQAETRAKWRERFERLLAEVHRRTSQFSSEEIEAELRQRAWVQKPPVLRRSLYQIHRHQTAYRKKCQPIVNHPGHRRSN